VSQNARPGPVDTHHRSAGRGVDVVRRAQPSLGQLTTKGGSESRGVLRRCEFLPTLTVATWVSPTGDRGQPRRSGQERYGSEVATQGISPRFTRRYRPKPTARSNASTAPCSTNGPTSAPTAQTPNVGVGSMARRSVPRGTAHHHGPTVPGSPGGRRLHPATGGQVRPQAVGSSGSGGGEPRQLGSMVCTRRSMRQTPSSSRRRSSR
jgi:hypothetical protein